ncbi:Vegetative incompatibility HET-E-1 [Fusarium acutatum]|uniref:Vegetative incompatibility HET-E-1 n=1 Tax=Fusarium acutatum TaxID=78861 RepID=A0A8H4NCP7_9HYPO|nr:Vegetative incompatibility HET-E-1 [Fusarium acutatum]
MAEALGVVASAIAVIQISKEVISACKFYIEALRSDAPTSLRTVLIEVSTLKSVLENLEFISKSTFATLAWPLKQGQVQDLLQQINRHKDGIQLALTTEVTKDIKDIKAASEEIRSILTEEQRHRVHNWLTTTDPSPIYNRSRKLYENGTGSWMIRSQYWTDWLASIVRCLWVHGIPGAGKTILASWLIQNIQDHCKRVSTENSPCTSAYYYCYFGHHQDEAAPFLRWVITQLSRRAEIISTLMHDFFKRGGEPSIHELLEALEEILQVFNCVYIVIDAVDECDPRDELLELIQTLVTDRRFSNLQILVMSRKYIDIERVMKKISVSVLMSNELVEEDIRLHVRSIIRSNMKFQCWPDDLLIEVEDAISTQAKGMFRWAVCQLHELQRLSGERDVVSKALERLPKDLDETYDRIFLRIPQDDWKFVSHAFQWLWFYGELDPDGTGIPSVLLLDAIESSMSRIDSHNDDVLYNPERLFELCGCLINSLMDSVSFAHYTVKEYLNSERIRQGPLIAFSTERDRVLSTCLDVLLLQAQKFALQDLKDLKTGANLLFDMQDLWKNLSFHSFFHIIHSLRIWGEEISKDNEFYERVKRLLCPSTQYFRCLGKIAFNEGSWQWVRLLTETGLRRDKFAWTIDWNENLAHSDASLFLSMFLVTNDMDSPLISRLVRETDLKVLLSNRIVLSKKWDVHTWSRRGARELTFYTYVFDGQLVEMMVHFVDQASEALHSLLVNYTGLYDPSMALLYFIGHCPPNPKLQHTCKGHPFSPLQHLLEAGAQPNLPGYPLTALQMAVGARNLEVVQLLLRFGADPNYICDPSSSAWPANSLMASFKQFHGMSGLCIHRSDYCVSFVEVIGDDIMDFSAEPIEQLLLAYGARDFQWGPSEPLMAEVGNI